MDLKKFRHDLKLGQKDLADIFGCGQGNISNIECGLRNITALQIRLLIERFGIETVSKYATPEELPNTINIDMHKTEITGNQAPVQNGDGNHMTTDSTLVAVMKQQSDQITTLLESQKKRDEQIDRLLTLLEKK